MTASYTQGDSFESIPLPGDVAPTHTYGETFGDQFHAPVVREVLASMIGFHQRGVVLAGGQGVLPTGTVLAQKTSDKKYYVYNSSHSDGTQNAAGFLRKAADTGLNALAADTLGNLVDAGKINTSVASGLDTNAITVLNGRVDTGFGVFYF